MLPEISPNWLKWFKRYLRYWYVPWHLRAIRISRRGRWPVLPEGALIVVSNHPSWWDPLVLMLLTDLLPGRRHFAPMDAVALQRYRFFARLGMFGVDRQRPREFLRTARAILAAPDTVLWMTPQGRFADVRERPVRLEGGVGHLAARPGPGVVLPVALEYPFWQERAPEALVYFGEPVPMAPVRPAEMTARIAGALEKAQDALAREAQSQRAENFDQYVAGRVGVGLAYDGWRWLRARWRQERYDGAHATVTRRATAG